MKKQIVITVCDKCRKEGSEGFTELKLDNDKMSTSYDLCEDCTKLFRAFMWNRLDEESSASETEEETTEEVEPSETEESMNGFVESFDPYNADWKRGVPKIMKAIRQKHGLTQKELGLKLGLSENSIGRIEGGFMVRPKRDTMDKFGILKTLW